MQLMPSKCIRASFESNCDTDSYDISVESGTFSGGEVQVRVKLPAIPIESVTLVAHLRNSQDVMELLMVTDAIRRERLVPIRLFMPYLPYARQDRVCAPGEALSLKVFADLINAQNYFSVMVNDCHSDVGVALIDRCFNAGQEVLVSGIPMDNTILVAPDAGSLKKVMAVAKKFGVPYVRADKTRDPATGAITGTVVYSEFVGDKNFLILDDICDGGRTFIELAKTLRKLTVGKVSLYVTHGIFSQGVSAVTDAFDTVYCSNSFVEDNRLVMV